MQQVMPLKNSGCHNQSYGGKGANGHPLTLRPESPIPVAAIPATFSSYCKAPPTESLSQDKGTPRVPAESDHAQKDTDARKNGKGCALHNGPSHHHLLIHSNGDSARSFTRNTT